MERPGMERDAATMDSIESWCYRNLIIGGILLVVGLIFTLTMVLAWWGVPLFVVGVIIIAYDVVQTMRRLRARGIDVTCPYCQRHYRIEPERRHLLCDDCQREVPIPRAA